MESLAPDMKVLFGTLWWAEVEDEIEAKDIAAVVDKSSEEMLLSIFDHETIPDDESVGNPRTVWIVLPSL